MTQMLSQDRSLPNPKPIPEITIPDTPKQDDGSVLPDDATSKWKANIKSEGVLRVAQADLNHAKGRPAVIDQGRYREFILNSVAYKWLVARLSRKLALDVVDVNLDVPSSIHQEVLDCYENSGHGGMKRPSQQYKMTFSALWNPIEFLNQQFGTQCDIGRLLGEILTLTGTATDAQILPCSEYLNQTWPTTGLAFLELLRKALVSQDPVSGKLEDKTSVRCGFTTSGLIAQVKGIADSIAIIGEQIGWLGAALRSSCSDSGFSTCQPRFKIFKARTDEAECSFHFPTFPMDLTKYKPGQCWHAILRNPVIVEGYPIPRRKRYGVGLEMPLNVMAGLNLSPRIHKYEGNYYLKGYSTALVPTEKIGNMVLWHLYYSDDGSRLPYPNPTGLQCTDVNIQDLTAARHVVGWCSNAKFMTGAADMNYDIGASQLQRPGKEFALEKISFSFGQFVTGGCQFAIGRKDRHVRATKGTYIDKLKWLDKKYVTLWDVDDERGWLVNGNAALLHLLRSSLQHSSTDKFSSDFHFRPQDFQESKNPHSLDSALEVLRNSKNQQLELYDKDTDIQQGCVATSRTTVKDRVEELYEVLEKLFDYTVTSEASAKGLNAKSRFQDHLEGWDFTDISTNRDPFFIKRTTLGFSMLGWPDLVRANYAIILFGKGFGDLIEAVGTQPGGACKEWMTVPKNRNLLCVSTSHLKDIIHDGGGNLDTSPITVMPGLFWKAPPSINPFDVSCQCETSELLSAKHHAVQSLISSKLWTGRSQACVKLDDHSRGAVIFGPLIDRKRPWGSSASISRSGSQSSNLSALGGSTTSTQTISQDLASSSSSIPASSPVESQGQTISGTSVVDPEASPPASGSTIGSLNPVEELLGTREFRRFRNWFPSKKARRN
ncbi:uncharacterized protein B0J16DRAFT_400600 [Fusarium flagelliforme]|uniref:uncharacterized protein n=1 Tax=Fusarium flagelliforme TaxID=2675880 RepID=UPI001E8D26DE|nr:uncharacterized protein B0J16DRAFT_400600 [Fusarium flagelliforme]KAH7182393.1 hypothetical protein B0J16DRAFT_400600 [Fusarium flagelliforme]